MHVDDVTDNTCWSLPAGPKTLCNACGLRFRKVGCSTLIRGGYMLKGGIGV